MGSSLVSRETLDETHGNPSFGARKQMNVTVDLYPHNQRMLVIWVGRWETDYWRSRYPCITNLVLGTCFVADPMEMRGPKVRFIKNATNRLFHLWLVLMYSLKPTSPLKISLPHWQSTDFRSVQIKPWSHRVMSRDQPCHANSRIACSLGRWTCQRRCEPDTTQRETGKTFDVGAMLASEDGQSWYWMSTGRTLNIVVSECLIFLWHIYNSVFGRVLARTTSKQHGFGEETWPDNARYFKGPSSKGWTLWHLEIVMKVVAGCRKDQRIANGQVVRNSCRD